MVCFSTWFIAEWGTQIFHVCWACEAHRHYWIVFSSFILRYLILDSLSKSCNKHMGVPLERRGGQHELGWDRISFPEDQCPVALQGAVNSFSTEEAKPHAFRLGDEESLSVICPLNSICQLKFYGKCRFETYGLVLIMHYCYFLWCGGVEDMNTF